MGLMITVHWCWFALMLGFSLVGVVTLVLQLLFASWCARGQYEKFERGRY